jgi:predicted DNA-binding transcriptional regulator AlpA
MRAQSHAESGGEIGTPSAIDRLLSQRQAADYLGLTIPTLQRQRTDGTGPRFLKLGKRKVAYRLSDIHEWIDGRVVRSTADARVRGLR